MPDTTSDIMDDLRKVYDEKDADTIYSMAILRVRHPGLKNSRMKRDYDESILARIFPSPSMSKNAVSVFLQKIGGAGNRIRGFMKARGSRLPAGALLALDGMLQTDDSDVDNLSAVSRKSKVRGGGDGVSRQTPQGWEGTHRGGTVGEKGGLGDDDPPERLGASGREDL